MKKKSLFLSLFSLTALVGCNNDIETGGNPTENIDKAYVSLSISAPATSRSGGTEEGTQEESAITSVYLKAFNSAGKSVFSAPITAENGRYKANVAKDAMYFYAVANAADGDQKSLDAAGNWDSTKAIAIAADLASLTAANSFMMVNAGLTAGSDITNALVKAENLSTNKSAPTEIKIAVDRLVSKFQYEKGTEFKILPVGAKGEITGAKLNVTNKPKNSFLYSDISILTAGTLTDYRTDKNMVSLGIDVSATTFNWLKNKINDDSFLPEAEYTLENTASAAAHNYNNLTQSVIKATYVPAELTTVNIGDSWFAIFVKGEGTKYYDFAGVQGFYNALDKTKDSEIIVSMNTQLNHILGSKDKTWADVTIAELDAIKSGGYMAATVPGVEGNPSKNYIVQYYQKSICYYDLFIQHDGNKTVGEDDRWGMVRNNSYTLTINSIKKPGLPYIPDPTDPEIVDPTNPDPTDPEKPDVVDAYIEAVISVNPWTIWNQDADLE